jgi:alpha-galactosidase
MKSLKIVVIGAGSVSFGLHSITHLLQCEKLRGSHLALVDLDAPALAVMKKLALRMNREWGASMKITSATDRARALPDADFVIISVAQDRERRWRHDEEVARKYGIVHYAENSGPGGVFHTARSVNLIMPMLRDMERLCPRAWVLNFTNPVPRVTLACTRYTSMKMVGICHQVNFAFHPLGWALARDLGITLPENVKDSYEESVNAMAYTASRKARALLNIKAAGTNHNSWLLDVRRRDTGEDLYPLFAKRIRALPADWQPLSRKLFDCFGLYPIPGDEHLSEYVPWVSNESTGAWKRYNLHTRDFAQVRAHRKNLPRRIKRLAEGTESLDTLLDLPSERAAEIISGIAFDENSGELAVNVPNEGYITNLPQDGVVEVPGLISSFGVRGVGVGALPAGVAEFCRREMEEASLAVDAAVKADRKLALQAMLYAPGVNDIDMAEKLVAEYLKVHRKFLPAFK